MSTWESLTFTIGYDKKARDWLHERRDGQVLVGLNSVLAAYCSEGWELVSLQPERFEIDVGFGRYHMEPVAYRATFRRASG